MKMAEAASRTCRRPTIVPLLALALLGIPTLAHASGVITSITPACAATGSDVVITGRGFGAPNVTITVGGVPAQVLNATGYRVAFVVPVGVPSGVTAVKSMNPGGLTGVIAFRVQGPEICGNGTDDDCNGIVDDPDICHPVNHPPVANAGPAQTAPVGATVHLDGTGSSDPDGNPLTFQWTLTGRPAGSTATLVGAATPTPTLTLDKAGSYTGQLVVNDGSLSSAPSTVVISTVNSAPVANAGPNQTGFVGTSVTLDGSGSSDVDGDRLTYSWSLVSRPSGSTAVLADPTTVHPSFTIDVFGTYVAQLIVNDGTVNSAPATVTISTLNSPPVAHAGPDQSGFMGSVITLDGSASSDVDGDALTYQWALTSRPAGSTATLSDRTLVQPTFVIDVFGTYVAQLIVNDGIVNSAPATVTISTLNSRPVANAGSDQGSFVGTAITLDGSGSFDVDGQPLTYRWALITRPSGSTASLSDPLAVQPTFVLDKAGTYVAQLIVNDGSLDSDPATSTITTLNSKPVANAGPGQSGFVGTTITLDGSGSSDVDGDLLTYLWALTAKPLGSTAVLSDPSAVQPTFVLDKAGTYVAQLIVNDGTLNSDPATVTITTLNSKPVANAGANQTGFVGTTITLNGDGSSDVDGDLVTYLWTLTARPQGSTAMLANPSVVHPTFVIDKPGTYVAQLIVNDGSLESDPATVTISTLNSKPVANAGPDQGGFVGTTITLDGSSSSDVDGDSLTYLWALIAVPAGSAAALSDSSSVHPSFVPDVSGTYVAQLTVNDGTLNSDPATVVVSAVGVTTTTTTTSTTTLPPPPGNRPPLATAGATQAVAVGQAVTLDGTGSFDPDGDPIVFEWTLLSAPRGSRAILTGPTTATPSLTPDLAGVYEAQLIVYDPYSSSTPATVTIAATSNGPGVVVTITEPANGASLPNDRVRVRGTVQGPPNSGVSVNGVVALVYGGAFVAEDVPLQPGTNLVTAIASVVTGQAARFSITLTSAGVAPTLKLTAFPPGGTAPLHVSFKFASGLDSSIQALNMDFDGDGTSELTSSDPGALLEFDYQTPGIYLAHLRVTDREGTSANTDVAVTVDDPAEQEAVIRSVWNGMNAALLAGDVTGARVFLDAPAVEHYGPIFDALLPFMPDIIASYSPLVTLTISSNVAEYGLKRTIDGEDRLFLVDFLRGGDGVWRLDSM